MSTSASESGLPFMDFCTRTIRSARGSSPSSPRQRSAPCSIGASAIQGSLLFERNLEVIADEIVSGGLLAPRTLAVCFHKLDLGLGVGICTPSKLLMYQGRNSSNEITPSRSVSTSRQYRFNFETDTSAGFFTRMTSFTVFLNSCSSMSPLWLMSNDSKMRLTFSTLGRERPTRRARPRSWRSLEFVTSLSSDHAVFMAQSRNSSKQTELSLSLSASLK
mmetsp:Transcript_86567/g.253402  ORF Transcript_86567/g.253402 Transcript_86567/m.253402 type:complete len:219 (-) Transcript_86567:211-867(-)